MQPPCTGENAVVFPDMASKVESDEARDIRR